MRKISNLVSPILMSYRYQYQNLRNPWAEFYKLRKNEVLPAKTKGNVLILSISASPGSSVFEGICGYALKLRGYNVHALFCGQFLPKCEMLSYFRNTSSSLLGCSLCNAEQKKFSKAFGLVEHYYKDIISREKIDAIKSFLNTKSATELLSIYYDGVFFGTQIKESLIRHYLRDKVGTHTQKEVGLIRKFAYSTLVSYEVTKQLIIHLKPKFAILSHGFYSTWGAALEALQKYNIRSIVWNRGYYKHSIIAEHNKSYVSYDPNKNWQRLVLSQKNKLQLRKYFIKKQNSKESDDYVSYYEGNKHNILDYPFLTTNRIKFAFFPNIPWDASAYRATETFESLRQCMQLTFSWFQLHPECDLIIRAHPAESFYKYLSKQQTIKDIIGEILPQLPKNIHFISSSDVLSSYAVSEFCDANLFYASTLASELSYFGKVSIQLGQSNFSNKGFLFEPNSVSEYFSLLDKASRKELAMSDEMKEKAEKYAYYWIYQRHIPDDAINRKDGVIDGYNFKNAMDLASGKYPALDWFIDRCIDGKPFVWDKESD